MCNSVLPWVSGSKKQGYRQIWRVVQLLEIVPASSWRAPMLLTAEPSLQHLLYYFSFHINSHGTASALSMTISFPFLSTYLIPYFGMITQLCKLLLFVSIHTVLSSFIVWGKIRKACGIFCTMEHITHAVLLCIPPCPQYQLCLKIYLRYDGEFYAGRK